MEWDVVQEKTRGISEHRGVSGISSRDLVQVLFQFGEAEAQYWFELVGNVRIMWNLLNWNICTVLPELFTSIALY